MGELPKGRYSERIDMYYVINACEAVTREGLCDTVCRALESKNERVVLDVVPFTEKDKPSKKYKPFRIQVFPWQRAIFVNGMDSCAHRCGAVLQNALDSDDVLVIFTGDRFETFYN